LLACPAQGEGPSPFDGKSLDGWTTQDGQPVTQGWEVVDGAIHLKKEGRRSGNIITKEEFGDFDLSFDWKIAERGNSGLKYRVRRYGNRLLGLEYQIYDDRGRGPSKGSTGALYDLYEPSAARKVKPVGEYNHARILVRGDKIEHWLNGELIVSAAVGDDQWRQRIAASKFNDLPDFGRNRSGKIMLTDHGSEVWYRNFVFKPLAEQP
jgi:hypothetical protein